MSADHLNPFWVLELPVTATPVEIERQKQKLLGMLELSLAKAATFTAGGATHTRTPELVRQAADELREPARRLGWELRATRDSDELGTANSLLDELCAKKRISADDVDRAAGAWDIALRSDALPERIASRKQALALDEHDSEMDDKLVAALESGVVRDLTARIAATPAFDLDPIATDIGGEARQRFIDLSLEPLELAVERLVAATDDLPRAMTGFAEHYERLTAGRGDLFVRSAFDAIYEPMANLAAERFNDGAHQLGATMFIWLRDRAGEAGDEEAYEIQRRHSELAREQVRAHHAVRLPDEGVRWWHGLIALAVAVVLAMRWCNKSPSHNPSMQFDMAPRVIKIPTRVDHMRSSPSP